MIFKSKNTEKIEKHGVKMHIYNTKDEYEGTAVVYQETEKGHLEEFYHEKSALINLFFGEKSHRKSTIFGVPKIL